MLKHYLGTGGISTGTWSLRSPGTIWFVFVVAENMVKLWRQFPACCAVLACTSGVNQQMLTQLKTGRMLFCIILQTLFN